MSLRIENQICYIDTDEVRGQWPANEVTIITDSEKSMSAVELQGQRVYITEAEADALTVAGATDGRKHLKATDSESVI
ncbi:DUF3203 family protein [Pseudomonas sp. TH05]|uniref:DUF3203 family protein n=1 Tax=unclassified Pseudomonas TaxID=196821 RepID=UPI000997AB7C|nr:MULTISPECIES: DUF3203 family protein [unclassified Pseudomonas]MBK5541007.1 DUF3203 family protein [Pseudomonas sp. TH07]MBK5558465.1 DUF3203 family protein [Pseudomonas sp. TH05]OOV92878.1 DUF3203 domain-containing protein [Pseudomonas sp. MF4836]